MIYDISTKRIRLDEGEAVVCSVIIFVCIHFRFDVVPHIESINNKKKRVPIV